MSLNYRLNHIANFTELKLPDGSLNPVTHVLTFATIPIGMPDLTKTNATEFFTHINMWEQAHGTFLNNNTDDGPVPLPLTYADIVRHIGLTTNASPKNKVQFHKDLATSMRREAERQLRNEKEAALLKRESAEEKE